MATPELHDIQDDVSRRLESLIDRRISGGVPRAEAEVNGLRWLLTAIGKPEAKGVKFLDANDCRAAIIALEPFCS